MTQVLVRLRWQLTRAALARSPWQLAAFIIGCVFALGFVIAAGAAGWIIGGITNESLLPLCESITVIIGTLLIIGAAIVQAMYVGESSTLKAQNFATYGIPERTLQWGFVVAGLTGIPAICACLCMMALAMMYRNVSVAATITAVVAAPLIIAVAMCFSKMVLAACSMLASSQRGTTALYVVLTLSVIVLAQIPNMMISSSGSLRLEKHHIFALSETLGWLPLGTLFALPFDVARHQWIVGVAKIAIALAFAGLCFAVSVWCTQRERKYQSVSSTKTARKGIGAFAWMPDSSSGAISARVLILLKRDARQSLLFLMPIIIMAICACESQGIVYAVWQSLLWCGLLMTICASNALAYDGTGFAMQVLAGTSGFTDRIGRVRVYVLITIVYFLLLSTVAFIITSQYHDPNNVSIGLTFISVAFSSTLAALGVCQVCSCTLMYPVASMEKPFSSPQGRGVAQMFMPLLYMIAIVIVMIPTIIATIIAMITGATIAPIVIPVALINGVGVLILGTWLGGTLLNKRMLNVLHTLDEFASLQR